jgi:hypothetical protein
MFRDAADDVALGDYPNELPVLVDHRRGPYPIFDEHLDDRRDSLLRPDSHDTITFVLQDSRNLRFHVSISFACQASDVRRQIVSQRSTYSGVFVCAQLQLAPLAPLKTMLIKRSERWAGTKVPLRWDGCPELTGRRWAAIPRVPHFGQAATRMSRKP